METPELFYGKQGAGKMQQLKEGLAEIEKNYSEYFENRAPKYSVDKNDRLHNHYLMTTNQIGASFSFYASSDLDDIIKSECTALFNKIFNL